VKVNQSTRSRRNIEMFSRNSQYDWLMKTLENSIRFDRSDPAKFRLHVLEHYYKHGWKSAINAFKISRGSLYNWKRDFEKSKNICAKILFDPFKYSHDNINLKNFNKKIFIIRDPRDTLVSYLLYATGYHVLHRMNPAKQKAVFRSYKKQRSKS